MGRAARPPLMDRLGRELASQGKRVILTTTTKIYKPREYPSIIGSGFKTVAASLAATLALRSPVVLGREITAEGKLTGIDPDWPRAFLDGNLCDAVLVEADGAAHKPIKGYAVHEPVFPRSATLLIPVLGYDALGIPIDDDHIHRVEAFCTLTGARPGGRVTIHNFLAVMAYMIGIGIERCPGAAVVPAIDKMDLSESTGQIRSIAPKTLPRLWGCESSALHRSQGEDSRPVHLSKGAECFRAGSRGSDSGGRTIGTYGTSEADDDNR